MKSPSPNQLTPRLLFMGVVVFPLTLGIALAFVWFKQTGAPLPIPFFHSPAGKPQTSFSNFKSRSKAPGIILSAIPTRQVDATGGPTDQSQQFSLKQNPLYIVMKLNSPPPGTRLEYVRYLNDKYLDHRSMSINAPAQYANFQWLLPTPLASHLAGTYLVKLYTNGVFEQRVNFTISRTATAGWQLTKLP